MTNERATWSSFSGALAKLEKILKRENKLELAEQCFKFLETRTSLDLAGLTGDIFEH